MTSSTNIFERFYAYQHERFPLAILVPSLIPAILSSGAVVGARPGLQEYALALGASVLYLLLIRIIDEHRDFSHDNTHHRERPVQVGVISKNELRFIGYGAVALLLGFAFLGGTVAFGVMLVMLAYSFIAGKEFFLEERLRARFFLYNGINVVQMLLMQLFVYAALSENVPLSSLVIAHFLFTSLGTLAFEFARKLKVPGTDGTGKDTYTWYVGFNRALVGFVALASVNAALFFWVMTMSGASVVVYGLASSAAVMCVAILTYHHARTRSTATDQLMQLAFFVAYGVFNICIYFAYA